MKKLDLKKSSTIVGGNFAARLQKQRRKCDELGQCARYQRMLDRIS